MYVVRRLQNLRSLDGEPCQAPPAKARNVLAAYPLIGAGGITTLRSFTDM